MKFENLESIKLLPQFMQKDKFNQSLCRLIDFYFKDMSLLAVKQSYWNVLDRLSDTELDRIAYELNIDWYDSNADKKQKIETIKLSTSIFEKRGTKWAVENALQVIFGNGKVIEWFEYGGNPYHFKIEISTQTTQENLEKFYNLIDLIKNTRSHLETLDTLNSAYSTLYDVCVSGKTVSNTFYQEDVLENVYDSVLYGSNIVSSSVTNILKEDN